MHDNRFPRQQVFLELLSLHTEFGGCPLFGSRKCTAFMGIAGGTSTVVRFSEDVHYREGLLSEIPLYIMLWNHTTLQS